MGDNDQKQQEQPKPAPPPPPILNHLVLGIAGLILVLSPFILLSGSNSVARALAKIVSGEGVLAALGGGHAGGKSPEEGEAALADTPFVDIAEAFRFDITPDWLVTRFPRVTAGLALLQFQGYRVPLVTGIAEDDLSGTVTYYFDASRQLRRITFEGTTGNPSPLLAFLAANYGFVYRATNNPAVYLYVVPEAGSKGDTHSYLWIRPRATLTANDPCHRFDLSLVLERPG